MITSVNTEKYNKICSFIMKGKKKPEHFRNISITPQYKKTMCKHTHNQHYTDWENLKAFPLRSGTEYMCQHVVLEILSRIFR